MVDVYTVYYHSEKVYGYMGTFYTVKEANDAMLDILIKWMEELGENPTDEEWNQMITDSYVAIVTWNGYTKDYETLLEPYEADLKRIGWVER